jgi:hypothetical protein
MQELAKDKLFILSLEDLPHGERFLLWPCGILPRTRTGLGAKRETLYFINFNIKNESFKILNPSSDG